jgi:hypothetical protein
MTAVVIGATHKVLGTLRDGEKVVFTELRPDDGSAGTTVVRVDPLTKIFAYTWGVKENNLSGTALNVDITPGGTVSGKTTTSGPLLNVKTLNACTGASGWTIITVMSIGV